MLNYCRRSAVTIMVRFLAFLILLIATICLTEVPPAWASFCRNYHENSICIVDIKRSAKYYWEYRASVRINGVTRPREIYNCRTRRRITTDKNVVPFEPNGAGELICSLFAKSG